MKTLFLSTALTTLIPLAALAQDAPCANVDAGEWIGGSADASDISTASAPLDGNGFIPVGGSLVRQFTVSEAGVIRFEAKGSFGGDPIGFLYDASGAEIGMSDDGAIDFGVLGEVMAQPGTYCLQVQDVQGGLLPVDIRISREDQEPMQEAVGMGMGGSMGCFELDDQAELTLADGPQSYPISGPLGVQFDVTEPMALTLTATGSGNDPLLTLESETDGYLMDNDDSDGLDSRIDMTSPLDPGRYCVIVDTYEQNGSNVTLEVKELDLEELRLQRVNSGEISPLIGNHPITDLGTLSGRIVRDVQINKDFVWFSITVDQESLIMAESMVVDGSDPKSVLFDDVGREIDRNDDFGSDYGSRVLAPVSAGTYLLGIGSVNETGEATRLIVDQYLRVR